MKPFKEAPTGGRIEPICEPLNNPQPLGSQFTCWDGSKRNNQQRLQAQQHSPSERAPFAGRTCQSGPRLQSSRGPQPNRTKGPPSHSNSALPASQGSSGGPVTMVTATASVTVAVHPTLPGAAYQGYMHEGFDTDNESDFFEATKRTCDKTNFSSCKRDSVELQDLEATQGQSEHQLCKTQGKPSLALPISYTSHQTSRFGILISVFRFWRRWTEDPGIQRLLDPLSRHALLTSIICVSPRRYIKSSPLKCMLTAHKPERIPDKDTKTELL